MKLNIKKNNKEGYSIIEILVYLAIFTVMSIVVINSFIVILSSFSTIRSNHDLLSSGNGATERIAYEIRQAKSIDALNSNESTLQLNSVDESGVDMTIKFIKDGNALNIYKNGSLVGNLLNQNVVINSLSFKRIVLAKTEAVKIDMNLEDARDKSHKKENFHNTIVVRGGY